MINISEPARVQILHEPLPTVPASQIISTDRPRVLAIGGGGNAPGIVAAMVAYVEALLEDGFDVVGLFGSWPALKNVGPDTRMIDYKNISPDRLRELITQGGTQLGVGRDILWKNEFHNVVKLKKMLKLIGACGVGGDGTLSAAQALQYSLDPEMKAVIDIIMGGKTVDNDMAHCDTAIGFMTSIFKSQESIHNGLNLAHGKSTTTVVDIYGRNNGNIALHAASLVAGNHPLITLIPEQPITREHFLSRHAELKQEYGYVCVVVAEGFNFLGDNHSAHATTPTDGKGNKKLEGGKLIENVLIQQSDYAVEGFKPGWDTRECPPIGQDIALAQAMGRAVAALVKKKLWGTAIAAQGSFDGGFDLKPLPLWQIETGNIVSLDMYDADRLCPTEACKVLLQNNTNPPIRDLDVSSVDCLRVSHEALMGKIQQGNLGELVNHNGVWIPRRAIVPDRDGKEQVTVWTKPIGEMLS